MPALIYVFSPFLVVVLKVSFDRTLVAELTPETFQNHRLSSQSQILAAVFQFGISQDLLGLELPAVKQRPQDNRATR